MGSGYFIMGTQPIPLLGASVQQNLLQPLKIINTYSDLQG
jgi:hypothetical protein